MGKSRRQIKSRMLVNSRSYLIGVWACRRPYDMLPWTNRNVPPLIVALRALLKMPAWDWQAALSTSLGSAPRRVLATRGELSRRTFSPSMAGEHMVMAGDW
jgi:hypothetical protein